MTLEGRLGVAVCSTLAGVALAWGVYHLRAADIVPAPIAAAARVANAPPVVAPVLWVLAIGVSRYQRSELNLQFADLDARAIAEAFGQQRSGLLYADAKIVVLANEEVTRESVLDSITRFLGQAGPNDVAVIFIAGHGVQDRASGSYYFLPFPATENNLVTTGLRMSDFDEMIRIVRQQVRGTVVMLDTCHAGALQLGPRGDELPLRAAVGDGFFLLAATKPGEESSETPALAHGAFTHALLAGLRGAADADRDGWIAVSELFGYVAREVPRLTEGMQHPYHRMEGIDLVLAAASPDAEPPALPPGWEPTATNVARPARARPNSIGVMAFDNVRADAAHEWVGSALRVAFNTELSKVRALHVYAPELIDRTAQETGLDQLATAQTLGIDRLITGSFNIVGSTLRIDASIVDVATGIQEGSDSVEGDLGKFFELQKKLVFSILRRLRVKLSPEEGKSIRNESNTDVDAYRLLLETEELVEGTPASGTTPATPRASAPTAEPQSNLGAILRSLAARLTATANAAEGDADAETGVRLLLEEYRIALERKDLDRLAELYVSFSGHRRDALRAYFDNAGDLGVELTDVQVTPHGGEVAVSYVRRDRFIDRATGKEVRLEVRITRVVIREGGRWKIAGRP